MIHVSQKYLLKSSQCYELNIRCSHLSFSLTLPLTYPLFVNDESALTKKLSGCGKSSQNNPPMDKKYYQLLTNMVIFNWEKGLQLCFFEYRLKFYSLCEAFVHYSKSSSRKWDSKKYLFCSMHHCNELKVFSELLNRCILKASIMFPSVFVSQKCSAGATSLTWLHLH